MSIKVSVAILSKDAGPLFARVLEAIRAQRFGGQIELVVLDSGSSDGTVACAKTFGAKVHRRPAEEFCFGASRDFLFEQCCGEIVVTLSQDAVPAHPQWLEEMCAPILNDQADIVVGAENTRESRFYWEREGWFYFCSGWRRFIADNGGLGFSCVSLAMQRDVWRTLRFSPARMAEDKLLQQRAFKAGLRSSRNAKAEVLHSHHYTLRALWTRCANEGLALRDLSYCYTILQGIRDLGQPGLWKDYALALSAGKLRSFSELFFPLIRVLALCYGSMFLPAPLPRLPSGADNR